MCCYGQAIIFVSLLASSMAARGQDAKQVIRQAVQTELAADDSDHSRWMFLDVDRKPRSSVDEWVAQTSKGDVKRVLVENGDHLSDQEQRLRMDAFAQNAGAQAKQHKSDEHDDQQARQMLNILPQAFIWTKVRDQNGATVLHFAPDPHFNPPSYQARVFAAMEGDMTIDDAQHRIISLKGHMIRDVTFGFGILGDLKAGGSFDVERRQLKPGIWQITETHVHIEGRALLFKSISDQEDDERSQFQELTSDLSLPAAEQRLMAQQK
jgi:hypothetical protein